MASRRSESGNDSVYKDRIVAFIDVLGWGASVEASTQDVNLTSNLLSAANEIRELLDANSSRRAANGNHDATPRLTQFSDSLVISYLAKPDWVPSAMVQDGRDIAARLLQHGFLARGAVVLGKLYHSETVVFGPALNAAVALESKAAITPRIILSRPVAERVNAAHSRAQTDLEQRRQPYRLSPFSLKDGAGERFVHWLCPEFVPSEPTPADEGWPDSLQQDHDAYTQLVKRAKRIAHQGLRNNTDERVLEKYRWFARYINASLERIAVAEESALHLPFWP